MKMLTPLLAFSFSLVLAYWNKGLYIFLLYTLLWEIILLAAFSISYPHRLAVVSASILGYLTGSLLFYSYISWQRPHPSTRKIKLNLPWPLPE